MESELLNKGFIDFINYNFMDKNKYADKLCEYYFNSRGRRITSNYDKFFAYVSKHGKNNLILYAEWITFDNLVITSVSAFYDSVDKSVTKIKRDSI